LGENRVHITRKLVIKKSKFKMINNKFKTHLIIVLKNIYLIGFIDLIIVILLNL